MHADTRKRAVLDVMVDPALAELEEARCGVDVPELVVRRQWLDEDWRPAALPIRRASDLLLFFVFSCTCCADRDTSTTPTFLAHSDEYASSGASKGE
ncbi:MAG: hypothetical protein A2V77_15425 [Anaeromyxobacter sp. RBG_16_69_14]|nr:MAG: hypothetical protein A2V77_15425 [Anaeromyxobacter sp. RBG_16_69_14]